MRLWGCPPIAFPRLHNIVTNVLLQALKNVIFAMKCLKVPRTHKTLDPTPCPMTL